MIFIPIALVRKMLHGCAEVFQCQSIHHDGRLLSILRLHLAVARRWQEIRRRRRGCRCNTRVCHRASGHTRVPCLPSWVISKSFGTGNRAPEAGVSVSGVVSAFSVFFTTSSTLDFFDISSDYNPRRVKTNVPTWRETTDDDVFAFRHTHRVFR